MKYDNIKRGIFKSRPNRFIAVCEIDGADKVCHVKNTGRCKELLIPGATVFLEESKNPHRKTKYDLISVYKGDRLFNIDSQAPNKVFGEYLEKGGVFKDITIIKPETKYKNSRFDFYVEQGDLKTFIEVKGVTLENNGVLLFPDAPTERGVKHIEELISALEDGYNAYIAFIIQTDYAKYFTPNSTTHPEFSLALKRAEEKGVQIICLTCNVKENALNIKDRVPYKF